MNVFFGCTSFEGARSHTIMSPRRPTTPVFPWSLLISTMSLVKTVRLRVPAGAAKPGPAIGQALGPLGVNMAEFCKQFNDRTKEVYEANTPLGVSLSAMSDRSFQFNIRSPSTSYLVRKIAGVDKGPSLVDPEKPIGYITPEAIYEIAKIKHKDEMRWHLPLEGVARSVIGTARSIGIHVRESTGEEIKEEEKPKPAAAPPSKKKK